VPEEVEEAVDDARDLVGVAVVARGGHHLGQPLAGRRCAVVGAETARTADGLRDRPPHISAVRDALATEHLRVVGLARVGRDLAGESALADPASPERTTKCARLRRTALSAMLRRRRISGSRPMSGVRV